VSKADLWLNGGFFMFRRQILDEIRAGEDLVPDVLPRLSAMNQVLGYRYDGFWAPMDTLRDWKNLDQMVQSDRMPWAVWKSATADKAGSPASATVVEVDREA
jgi:glucose-1-phosphate cytidylyltransferase